MVVRFGQTVDTFPNIVDKVREIEVVSPCTWILAHGTELNDVDKKKVLPVGWDTVQLW